MSRPKITNDDVMGGVSSGRITRAKDGRYYWTGIIRDVPFLGSPGFSSINHVYNKKKEGAIDEFILNIENKKGKNRKVIVRLLTDQYRRGYLKPAVEIIITPNRKSYTIPKSAFELFRRGDWYGKIPSTLDTNKLYGYSLIVSDKNGPFEFLVG